MSQAFDKQSLDRLFDELRLEFSASPDYESLVRDAHVAVALSDAGAPLGESVDSRVAALVDKHRPAG